MKKHSIKHFVDKKLDQVAEVAAQVAEDFNPDNLPLPLQVGDSVNMVFGDAITPCTVHALVTYENKKTAHLSIDGFNTIIYNVDINFVCKK